MLVVEGSEAGLAHCVFFLSDACHDFLGYVVFAGLLDWALVALCAINTVVANRSLLDIKHRAHTISNIKSNKISHISKPIASIENPMPGIEIQPGSSNRSRRIDIDKRGRVRAEIAVGR